MKLNPRTLVLIPVVLLTLSCQLLTPTKIQTVTPTVVEDHFRLKPTFSPTSTPTPPPTVTLTPTESTPSVTPTEVIPPTPTPTSIPLVTQLRIYENIWNVVNDTYIYPDFNGLDWEAVHQQYRDTISTGLTNEQFYILMNELIFSLGDEHSFYMTPQEVAEQKASFEGTNEYAGIGVYVSSVPERNHAVILSIAPGSPADAAGLKPRDSILAVDGTPILDENGYLRDIVRGTEGTAIDVTVQTPGEEPRQVQIIRQMITGNYPVAYQVITTPEGKRIGYIFLITFMVDSVDEQVAAALRKMTADAPLDGLILDNRMNEGGSSYVFEPMLSYFVDGTLGTFVSRTTSDPIKIKLHDINGSAQVPLVVLVGSGTASFGEIFSGILQDTGRAYVIGTTTHGNVEVLWGYDFEDGSQLWLANETFKPLNHPEQDWEQTGIVPDLTVPGDYDQYTFDEDPAIQAAVQYFSGR
jgi:carboxyl-terminal processing protease